MTTDQMEFPPSPRSSAGNPTPEQVRTHPLQMILKQCSKQKKHVGHAYEEDDIPFSCPGTPDIRDLATVAEQAREAASRVMERHNDMSLEWERAQGRERGIEDVDLPDES